MLGQFHSRSLAVYLLAWFFLALFYNSLILLAFMLAMVLVFNYCLDRLYSFKKMFSYIIPLALLIVVINSLFNQNGAILLTSFELSGHTVNIYREAFLYGIAMTTKLVLVLAIFNVFNQMIPAEKLMDIFGRCSGPVIMIMVISARLIPDLAVRARSIRLMQRSRGLVGENGNLSKRVRQLGPLVMNLLRATLQTALQMAEVMQARGYGNGIKRSNYCRQKWELKDWLLLSLTSAVFIVVVLGWYSNSGHNYTPLQQIGLPVSGGMVWPLIILSLPLLGGLRLSGRRV